MKITTVGRQITVPEDLKAQVAAKLKKLDKFFPEEGTATVTYSRKHGKECLEVTINASGTLFRAEEEADHFRDALDRIVDVIERQIRKNKTRLAKRIRENAFSEPSAPAETVEEDEGEIIRVKRFSLKPMTADEAVMQMNLLGHKFFVFRNLDGGETCVVYARQDGGYGLIVPDDD
ncbi:MAG: ribosome-associated translation inhibitor RaiA [Clostridia bacterium]|nr:ribosome-associated translation inhibitor RaiA [Clostridia bacterium]